ncbi:MAG: hypothetical protein HFJ66_04755 [Eggerthellaceae bacterium]|nr:hypothetical protein [Eggerthellaceae bacterium]
MSKIDLLPNEAILKTSPRIIYDSPRKQSYSNAELFLTNQALIVVVRGMLGGVKESFRFPLSSICTDDGKPKIQEGRSASGARQMHIFFAHGVESFTLGLPLSYDTGLGSSLKDAFTSVAEKEKRNIREWRDAICSALGAETGEGGSAFEPEDRRSIVETVAATVGAGVSTFAQAAKGAPKSPPRATQRCIGCCAPLSGAKGQQVTCKYCDTVQTIS